MYTSSYVSVLWLARQREHPFLFAKLQSDSGHSSFRIVRPEKTFFHVRSTVRGPSHKLLPERAHFCLLFSHHLQFAVSSTLFLTQLPRFSFPSLPYYQLSTCLTLSPPPTNTLFNTHRPAVLMHRPILTHLSPLTLPSLDSRICSTRYLL